MMPSLFRTALLRGRIITASELAVRSHYARPGTGPHPTYYPSLSSRHRRPHRTVVTARRRADGHRLVLGIIPRGRPSSSSSSGGGGSKADRDDSSVVDEDSGDAPADDGDIGGSTVADDGFPWRHESSPPARLLAHDDLSGMPNNLRARFVRRLVSCKELNLSPWDALPVPFLAREWEVDLATNFKIAFGLALEELLSSVYRGTVPVVRGDGDMITVDTSGRIAGSGGNANLMENNTYLNRMLDKSLIARYQSFDADKYHLKFSMRPYEAKLESIFAV
jgi:hypothetical protein